MLTGVCSHATDGKVCVTSSPTSLLARLCTVYSIDYYTHIVKDHLVYSRIFWWCCHRRVLHYCNRLSRRRFRLARLLWLNTEKSVEESDAEFLSAREIHEKVDGVVGAVDNLRHGVEEKFYSLLFWCLLWKCSVGVSEEVDVIRGVEHDEHDAYPYQHHCRWCNLHTVSLITGHRSISCLTSERAFCRCESVSKFEWLYSGWARARQCCHMVLSWRCWYSSS